MRKVYTECTDKKKDKQRKQTAQNKRTAVKRRWCSSTVESAGLTSARTLKQKGPLTLAESLVAALAHLTPGQSFHLLSPTNKHTLNGEGGKAKLGGELGITSGPEGYSMYGFNW